MPREKECFRDNLALIREMFPNDNLLNIGQVMQFTRRNYRTVKKMFTFKNGYISIVNLASEIS